MNTKEFKNKVLSLSDRIFPMVARILGNNAHAEDAVQDIMLKIWDKRKQLGDHPNIAGFVFLTAKNYCFDILKKKKHEFIDSQLLNMPENETNGPDQLEKKELNDIMNKIISTFPQQQKEIIIMRDIDGLEYIEIAEITHLKIEHLRVLLSRARKQLCAELKKIYCYGQKEV